MTMLIKALFNSTRDCQLMNNERKLYILGVQYLLTNLGGLLSIFVGLGARGTRAKFRGDGDQSKV